MNNPKVLLAALEERTSASGNRYLSGWLGKARIVGFLDKDAPDGKIVWQVYAQTPEDRGDRSTENGGATGRSNFGGGQTRGGHQQRAAQRRHESIPDVARRPAGDNPF